MVDIFERDLAGEFISTDDPEYEMQLWTLWTNVEN